MPHGVRTTLRGQPSLFFNVERDCRLEDILHITLRHVAPCSNALFAIHNVVRPPLKSKVLCLERTHMSATLGRSSNF